YVYCHYEHLREPVFPRKPDVAKGELAAGANVTRTDVWKREGEPAILSIARFNPDNFRPVGYAENIPCPDTCVPEGHLDFRHTRLPTWHADRRPFHYFATGMFGLIGLAFLRGTVVKVVHGLWPARDAIAAGVIEVDLRGIQPGQNFVVKWRGKPVFVRRRTQAMIDAATADDAIVNSLRDPERDKDRVKKPEWLVMLGVCTHLGCVPYPDQGLYGCFLDSHRHVLIRLPSFACPWRLLPGMLTARRYNSTTVRKGVVRDSHVQEKDGRPPLVATMKQLMLKGCQQQAIALFESSIDLADARAVTMAAKLYGKLGDVDKVVRCFEALDRNHPDGLTQVSIRVGLSALEREASWRLIICGQLVRKYPSVRIEPESFDRTAELFPIGTARGLLLDVMFNPAHDVPWTDRQLTRIAAAGGVVFSSLPGSIDLTVAQLRDCFGDKLVRPELKALAASNHPVIQAVCRARVKSDEVLEVASNTALDPLTHSALSRLGRSVLVWTTDGSSHHFDGAQGSLTGASSTLAEDDPVEIIANASGRIDNVFSSLRYLCCSGNTKALSAMTGLKKWLMSCKGRCRPSRVFSEAEISEGIDWIDRRMADLRLSKRQSRV
ncbi:hypothetical protein FOZ60_002417, partial [Perkinsus olseni]